ncbi:eukaryotic translation initiation factor 4E [Frankliniella occidentalis]|uniref:eIF-4F 25 kDa subunit n=1 Tax=Frankliniella occidentalis TaxID=133901 RepID=A0A9C6WRT2_FRAOC|nr:eukaryotic translation initiation factor 4E [Frankliniella occidentalis]
MSLLCMNVNVHCSPENSRLGFVSADNPYFFDFSPNFSVIFRIMADVKEVEREDAGDYVAPDNLANDMLIKHPLHSNWTLWYFEKNNNKTWEENQREITSFNTVEDFWSLYNHIRLPSQLRVGCDYSLFKKGIMPMWEDSANRAGGRWLINLDRKQRETDLDRFWLEILLCMVGEAFDEHSDDICGAVVNVRAKIDKIAVWTANGQAANSVVEIGKRLKERLNLDNKCSLGYQMHKDTMVKTGSVTRNQYTV